MTTSVNLLIIGAGPFGLAVAAWASKAKIDHLVVGEPMGFWQSHMPSGMLLRSACDWHLDPHNGDTIERYLAIRGLHPDDVMPIARSRYLDYAQWFQDQQHIRPLPVLVAGLDDANGMAAGFTATLEDGRKVAARSVVLALGLQYFAHIPAEIEALVPPGQLAHTCHLVDFTGVRGRRFLVVGGRQSAFEWAALLHEHGAADVHVCHRHPTPVFHPSEWAWANPLVEAMIDDPGWYRRLPPAEQHALSQRMWAEGRLKLEPWLSPRVHQDGVSAWPQSQVTSCLASATGELTIGLDSGVRLSVDHVICATGYKVDLRRIPLLAAGNLLARIETRQGFPILDEYFQTTIPNLYITGMAASQDFGPFWGFTAAVRTSATLIGRAVAASA